MPADAAFLLPLLQRVCVCACAPKHSLASLTLLMSLSTPVIHSEGLLHSDLLAIERRGGRADRFWNRHQDRGNAKDNAVLTMINDDDCHSSLILRQPFA